MELATLLVSILGIGVTSGIVIWQFQHQKLVHAEQLKNERERIVNQLEESSKIREMDEGRLRSEEKRWAHGQLVQRKLDVLLQALRFASSCRSLMAFPALLLNDSNNSDKEKQNAKFWNDVAPHMEKESGKFAKELMDKMLPVAELKFWYRDSEAIGVLDKFTQTYFAIIIAILAQDRTVATWRRHTLNLVDASVAVQNWMRTQLDPDVFAKAVASAPANPANGQQQ